MPGHSPIEIVDVSHSYRDDRMVLETVTLRLEPASVTALMGPNGSGKTTLAKLMTGLFAPSRGHVLIDGKEAARLPRSVAIRHVGLAFQNPTDQFFCSTVLDEVTTGLRA